MSGITRSGNTAKRVAKYRPVAEIVAVTPTEAVCRRLSELETKAWEAVGRLDQAVADTASCPDSTAFATLCGRRILPIMEELRQYSDEMECIVDKRYWPYPSYGEILFSVY